jgi:kynureninase
MFIELVQPILDAHGMKLLTPIEPERRGSQVALSHPSHGYQIIQALIARGVIGDFRAPDILRFGFAPLFLRYQDVWRAADHLQEVLDSKEYLAPSFSRTATVT